MTFTYPAVFTPHKDDKGFHAYFLDLECCVADGPDLERSRKRLDHGGIRGCL